MPPLIDLRWWPLTPVAIVWFTQYLEKSWENARKSKAVHQIIFPADRNWKQKYHGFICHCSNTPPDDAQRDIYVLSNISTFISTPDKLQRSKMYFSNWADCISPPQRSVAETSQQQSWSVSKSLTDPIKVDRDATNYDKERGRLTKSHALSYERRSSGQWNYFVHLNSESPTLQVILHWSMPAHDHDPQT